MHFTIESAYINVQALSQEELVQPNRSTEKQSPFIKERVIQVRAIQVERQNCLNAQLGVKTCEQVCALEQAEQDFLHLAMNKLKLSARGYHRLLKVARTIADLDNKPIVQTTHLQQALSFKQLMQMPR